MGILICKENKNKGKAIIIGDALTSVTMLAVSLRVIVEKVANEKSITKEEAKNFILSTLGELFDTMSD